MIPKASETMAKNIISDPCAQAECANEIGVLKGQNISFRLATPDDADYIYSLRTNPRYNQHLSKTVGSIADQHRWLIEYKAREHGRKEFYFIITTTNTTNCGTVRIYNVNGDSFTWGSWILEANKPSKAAFETAILIYRFAFGKLGLSRCHFDVRRENDRALNFHRRFGARETHSDTENIYFEYSRAQFEANQNALTKTL